MRDIVIGLHGDAGAVSPVMPHVGYGFNSAVFINEAKLNLGAALSRCGFDVFDCDANGASEASEIAVMLNRKNADAAIAVSFSSFGSGRNFNDVHGVRVEFSSSMIWQSRVLAEDVCTRFFDIGGVALSEGKINLAACPAIKASGGYLTCFDEAKLIYDPDYAVDFSERVAAGVCEHFDMPYVARDDIAAYPLLCSNRRGKKVKLLKFLLNIFGARLPLNGLYDSETDKAVRRFCADNGRPTDSGVTPAVWRDLLLTEPADVAVGSKNSSVRYIQHKLISKLYKAENNGVFGEATLTALNDFLKENAEHSIHSGETVGSDVIKLLSPVGGGRARLF